MKKQMILLALGLGLSAAPTAFAVTTSEQRYLDVYRNATSRPMPLSVVTPVVSGRYAGRTVDLLIEIDGHGRPGRITSRSRAEADLVETLAEAIARWEFAPSRGRDGQPKAAKVLLPVRIR